MDFDDDPTSVNGHFNHLTEEVEQIDGELEVRVAHFPLHGVTEDGTGTRYVPLNQRLICRRIGGEQWRVEFSDGQNILFALVLHDVLIDRTSRV
jgi:hypothetical protein